MVSRTRISICLWTAEGVGLHFTKVLDVQQLGLVDEDEEVAEITDRDYWLKRGTPKTVEMADKIYLILLSLILMQNSITTSFILD